MYEIFKKTEIYKLNETLIRYLYQATLKKEIKWQPLSVYLNEINDCRTLTMYIEKYYSGNNIELYKSYFIKENNRYIVLILHDDSIVRDGRKALYLIGVISNYDDILNIREHGEISYTDLYNAIKSTQPDRSAARREFVEDIIKEHGIKKTAVILCGEDERW